MSKVFERVPRKDDTFRISITGDELKQSLGSLRRGDEYRVRLRLCNKFGCSEFFERGLDFFVPTTTVAAPVVTPTKTTPGGKQGLEKGAGSAASLFGGRRATSLKLAIVFAVSFVLSNAFAS